MFGDEQIVGKKVIKTNSKSELKLPKFTKAEDGEELVLGKLLGAYMIFSAPKYFKAIELCEKEYKDAQNTEDKAKFRKLLRIMYSGIINELKCENGIIKLPSNLKNTKFNCQGQSKHLILSPIKKAK